jgi:hypothetical protein
MLKNFVPYNDTWQTRDHEPDAYEDLLGDGLEFAFGRDIHDIEGVVEVLNDRAVPSPSSAPWTVEVLKAELARLGA